MRTVTAWAVAAWLCAVGSLVSCDYQVTGYDQQPAMTRAPYLDRVLVTRHYVADVDEIVRSGVCKQVEGTTDVGCANPVVIDADPLSAMGRLGIQATCDFYIQAPKDFNDAARLVVAGHEVAMHCFGAKHG